MPEGIYAITAVAADEIRGTATSSAVVLEVEKPQSPSSAKIAWVSFHSADGTPSSAAATAGFTNASDVGYTRLLADNGHQVTRVVTSGSPNATLLNAFDLVIISRSVPSGITRSAGNVRMEQSDSTDDDHGRLRDSQQPSGVHHWWDHS